MTPQYNSNGLTKTKKKCKMVQNQKILNVPFAHQKGSFWCWAACVEMLLKYYSKAKYSNITQCEIVTQYLNKKNGNNALSCEKCIDAQGEINSDCEEALSLEEFKSVFEFYGLNCTIKQNVEWNDVVEKISSGHPIIASLKDDKNHVIVIQGFMDEDGGQYLVTNDPQNNDKSIQPFNTACTGDILGNIVFISAMNEEIGNDDVQSVEYKECHNWYNYTFSQIQNSTYKSPIKPYSTPIRNINVFELLQDTSNIKELSSILITLDYNRIDEISKIKGNSRFFGNRKIKCGDEWKTISYFYQDDDLIKKIKLGSHDIILDNTNYDFDNCIFIKEIDKNGKGEFEQIEMLPFIYVFYGFKYKGVIYWFTEDENCSFTYKGQKIKAKRAYKQSTILSALKDYAKILLNKNLQTPNTFEFNNQKVFS